MKQAVLRAPGAFELVEAPVPEIGPGDVLVRVALSLREGPVVVLRPVHHQHLGALARDHRARRHDLG